MAAPAISFPEIKATIYNITDMFNQDQVARIEEARSRSTPNNETYKVLMSDLGIPVSYSFYADLTYEQQSEFNRIHSKMILAYNNYKRRHPELYSAGHYGGINPAAHSGGKRSKRKTNKKSIKHRKSRKSRKIRN